MWPSAKQKQADTEMVTRRVDMRIIAGMSREAAISCQAGWLNVSPADVVALMNGTYEY